MKKIMTLGFLLALAIGASAQSSTVVPPHVVLPNAHGTGKSASANATNSTVPPVAKVPPVAVRGGSGGKK